MSELNVLTWTQAIEQTQDRFLSIAPTEMKFEKENNIINKYFSNFTEIYENDSTRIR